MGVRSKVEERAFVREHDPTGIFFVESAYSLVGAIPPEMHDHLLAKVWKSWAPTKVIVYLWELLQDNNFTNFKVLFHMNHNFKCYVFQFASTLLIRFSMDTFHQTWKSHHSHGSKI
ncbi:hypothetical protein L195_g036779 [Trifolium pratense]|uniref:Uncharacterized protein n=1 Tax=Trifolium pratense TaxID=57577 RepID=A0A2K3LQF3_TRIPR|nr:hypothetical protein L195_g036779 [Trifolium pratense]